MAVRLLAFLLFSFVGWSGSGVTMAYRAFSAGGGTLRIGLKRPVDWCMYLLSVVVAMGWAAWVAFACGNNGCSTCSIEINEGSHRPAVLRIERESYQQRICKGVVGVSLLSLDKCTKLCSSTSPYLCICTERTTKR